jgi:hypothetical protein
MAFFRQLGGIPHHHDPGLLVSFQRIEQPGQVTAGGR